MLGRVGSAAAALAVLATVVPATAAGQIARWTHRPATRYYLALGDSLAQGMQPDAAGVTRNTDQGYVDDLFAAERARLPGLQLVNLACGAESSGSMITGRGNEQAARQLHCDRTGGSQLTAAERFLARHHRPGEVPLLTIDIGANDVDGCASAADVAACVARGEAAIKRGVPVILSRLRAAAPPGTRLAGMTLYNPVLAGYFSQSPATRALAAASTLFLKSVNDLLSAADRQAGFRTADVAGAFASYDSRLRVPSGGRLIPVNVSRVCSWTWACTTPPSGPNIHANKNGYAVIARAFERAVGRLS